MSRPTTGFIDEQSRTISGTSAVIAARDARVAGLEAEAGRLARERDAALRWAARYAMPADGGGYCARDADGGFAFGDTPEAAIRRAAGLDASPAAREPGPGALGELVARRDAAVAEVGRWAAHAGRLKAALAGLLDLIESDPMVAEWLQGQVAAARRVVAEAGGIEGNGADAT